ncbi:hypothetical protein A1Q1_01243 [Trichosporon asahii var. asahii CBS 2479]|uniref:Uncharacterized protein n=1 Tax=Trichosporon asahii var. asahii (strain ATCC 90039 / CBS 2479 / JCM 2466 / KCTC 7840 / NBRC 103889/ NCYC 2677 / UAMH 7654) TaxID=1186058 RepID=J6EY94_TRIAS|nr:hypothetical protein A1Q1_01243 [Trichosporon asahii var. asahii CBS 2479]EJT49614.1 hypothetical protein A1Q1_01243 [Trichosporon asahii var. asahii CBS 2479]
MRRSVSRRFEGVTQQPLWAHEWSTGLDGLGEVGVTSNLTREGTSGRVTSQHGLHGARTPRSRLSTVHACFECFGGVTGPPIAGQSAELPMMLLESSLLRRSKKDDRAFPVDHQCS